VKALSLLVILVVGCGAEAAPEAVRPVAPAPPSAPPAVQSASAAPSASPSASAESDPETPQPQPPCNRSDRPVALVPGPALPQLARQGAVDGGIGGVSHRPVFQGSLYQRATIPIGKHDSLRVPSTALVAEGAKDGSVEVYVEKRLHFMGHPPEAMPLGSLRRNLGVATSADGTTLVVATYGEFGSIEGGASMRVFVRVPTGFAVKMRDGLAGDDSDAARWPMDEAGFKASDAGRAGYWYAPVNPATPWVRVTLTDDAQRVAGAAGTYPEEAPPCERPAK
jgi:hypothetical protein